MRAVNSVGAGAYTCASVTPLTEGFIFDGQSGGGSHYGNGLSSYDQTNGTVYSSGTPQTMSFTTAAAGVLSYYLSTYGVAGTSGSMSVAGTIIASTTGTNNTSGTITVTAGQTIVFTFTNDGMGNLTFQMYLTV